MGSSGNVFESPPAREGTFSALVQNSRKLASSCCGLRPDTTRNLMVSKREVKREPQNSSIPVPRFQRGAGVLDHTGGTYSHTGMVDYPRFLISEMHLGKFPDSMEFQSWKVNIKTGVCSQCTGPKRLR